MLAKDVMTSKLVTIRPDSSVKHAAELMIREGVSGLPVLNDEGGLEGIVTEYDLMQRIRPDCSDNGNCDQADALRTFIKTNSWRVSDVMTRSVISVDEFDSAGLVALLLRRNGIKRVVVTRADRVVGVVSRRDLLKLILSEKLDRIADGDSALRRSVLARLGFDAELNTKDIRVTVLNKVVLLEGNVDSADACEAARVAVEKIEGVAGVDNQLRVNELGAT